MSEMIKRRLNEQLRETWRKPRCDDSPRGAVGYKARLTKAIEKTLSELEKKSKDEIKEIVDDMINDERALALYYMWTMDAL